MTSPCPDVSSATVGELYERSGAAQWGVDRRRFEAALRASCASRLTAASSRADVERYVASLNVEDLALACGCRDGSDAAWEHFMREIQPRVHRAALAIAGATGRDLADALVSELYGTRVRDGERRSLFDYFHGRSRLLTWLRTVLAQRHVDAARIGRRTVSIDEPGRGVDRDDRGPGRQQPGDGGFVTGTPEGEDAVALAADRDRLLAIFEGELAAAVAALDPADRLRLSYYYLQKLTLAHIGRIVGEHESSVSRKIERARRHVRERVEKALRERHRLSDADIQQCYSEGTRFGTLDLVNLLDPGTAPASTAQDRKSSSFQS